MKWCCALALFAMGFALDDESVLVQKPSDWAGKMRSKELLEHGAQVKIQKGLVKLNAKIRVEFAKLHKRLDTAELKLLEKRDKLSQDLGSKSSMQGKAAVMKEYMKETLPLWQEMMKNATNVMAQVDAAKEGARWAKPTFMQKYLNETDASIAKVQGFIDSMADLQKEWGNAENFSEEEALAHLTKLQSKVDDGMNTLHDAEVDYTNAFDHLTSAVQKIGEKMQAEHASMVLVGEVTDNLHQEAHSVGKQVLTIFSELVGSLHDGRTSVERMVAQK